MISQILIETRSPATNASPALDLATALAVTPVRLGPFYVARARALHASIRYPVSAIVRSAVQLSTLNNRLSTSPILFVTDVLYPLNRLTVERFLNGNVRHCSRRRSAVPMLFVRRKPDHITRPNFFDWAAP